VAEVSYENRRQNNYQDRDASADRDGAYAALVSGKDALEQRVVEWLADWDALRAMTSDGQEIGDLNQLRADFITSISGAAQ
jgi:hypothetical protein